MVETRPSSHLKTTLSQLIKYGLVGFFSNLSGYLAFLIMTYYGVEPKRAMTLLYASVATLGFFGNRNITFKHSGEILGSGARYILAHTIGYSINYTILLVFVDMLGYRHTWVQGIAIFIVSGFLFIIFRFFVFPKTELLDSGNK